MLYFFLYTGLVAVGSQEQQKNTVLDLCQSGRHLQFKIVGYDLGCSPFLLWVTNEGEIALISPYLK